MWEKSSRPESGWIHAAAVFEAGWAQDDLRDFRIPLGLEELLLHQRRDAAAAGHVGVGDADDASAAAAGVDIPLVKLLPTLE